MSNRESWQQLLGVVTLIISSLYVPHDAEAEIGDDPILVSGKLDQFEMRDLSSDNTFSWDGQGWIGKDLSKLWIKSEGERTGGNTEEAELQFLYSKGVARYWDFQLGVRHDFEPSPSRNWLAVGFEGLAPYFFETDIALFIGNSGRTALRIESEYELLLTQKLILTPEIEINLYGKNDAATGVGSGLSDVEVGLRLRYEIRREFAPYIGVNWSKQFGNSADFARFAGDDVAETQLVVGLRAWF